MKKLLVLAAMIAVGCISTALASAPEPSPAPSGRALFFRCVACHTTSADARTMTGPHLEGIVGRKAGSLPDFAYSDTLRGADYIWDEARLDAFLEAPRTHNPGMCLTFMGMPKAEDRAALIAFLKNPKT